MLEELILPIMAAYVAMIFFAMVASKKRIDLRKTERRNKFFKALTSGLSSGTITTLTDVKNIYCSIAEVELEEGDYTYALGDRLREYLVELTSNNKKVIGKKLDNATLLEWKNKITEFINNNEEISPYDYLPFTERTIFTDISAFIDDQDVASTKRKICELASLIIARNEELYRLYRRNRWTTFISVVGLILTVAFGLTAIK
jgi:hypothetical protein